VEFALFSLEYKTSVMIPVAELGHICNLTQFEAFSRVARKEISHNKTRQNQEFYKQALMPTVVNSLGILLQISANSIVLSGSACLFNNGSRI